MRVLQITTLIAASLFARVSTAQEDEEGGVPVAVYVLDDEGFAIPNAWVRIAHTEGRRQVDSETGRWELRSVYDQNGNDMFFEAGMVLDFTISAPGFRSQVARYRVRGRRNVVIVRLEPLEISDVQADSNINWFRRTRLRPVDRSEELAPPDPVDIEGEETSDDPEGAPDGSGITSGDSDDAGADGR